MNVWYDDFRNFTSTIVWYFNDLVHRIFFFYTDTIEIEKILNKRNVTTNKGQIDIYILYEDV